MMVIATSPTLIPGFTSNGEVLDVAIHTAEKCPDLVGGAEAANKANTAYHLARYTVHRTKSIEKLAVTSILPIKRVTYNSDGSADLLCPDLNPDMPDPSENEYFLRDPGSVGRSYDEQIAGHTREYRKWVNLNTVHVEASHLAL